MTNWTIRDSLDLYHVLHWGSGFFAINDAGNVAVRPRTDDERSIDLLELVENLGQRGVRVGEVLFPESRSELIHL